MNHTEAVTLVTVLNRAGLVGALDGQTAVWAMGLEDIDYAEAQEVVKAMVATRTSGERWVTPGDIRTGIRKLHEQQAREARQIEQRRERADWLADDEGDSGAARIAKHSIRADIARAAKKWAVR